MFFRPIFTLEKYQEERIENFLLNKILKLVFPCIDFSPKPIHRTASNMADGWVGGHEESNGHHVRLI